VLERERELSKAEKATIDGRRPTAVKRAQSKR
jgi:hypothetical protein